MPDPTDHDLSLPDLERIGHILIKKVEVNLARTIDTIHARPGTIALLVGKAARRGTTTGSLPVDHEVTADGETRLLMTGLAIKAVVIVR